MVLARRWCLVLEATRDYTVSSKHHRLLEVVEVILS